LCKPSIVTTLPDDGLWLTHHGRRLFSHGKKTTHPSRCGPTILVSLLLFAACTLSAIVLYRFHADTAEGLADDIESRRKAVEMETSLRNLMNLVRKGSDQVDALNETIEQMIDESETLANTDEEKQLHVKLQASFGRYHRDVWQNRFDAELQPEGEAVKVACASSTTRRCRP